MRKNDEQLALCLLLASERVVTTRFLFRRIGRRRTSRQLCSEFIFTSSILDACHSRSLLLLRVRRSCIGRLEKQEDDGW